MPTSNPRLAVTLSPETYALVSRMATLTRSSKGSVVRDLLVASEPAFRRALALMEAARDAAQGLNASIAAALEAEQAHAEQLLASRLEATDRLTADLVAQAGAVRERRPSRGRASGHASGGAGAHGASRAPTAKRAA